VNIERIRFSDLGHLFRTLNSNKKLKYLVQRSYNDIADINNFRDGSNIDVLTNDYYMFKSLVDGRSNNTKYMRENDDGFYIQCNVIVGDVLVNIDVRYVGDHYFNDKWEHDMLERRVSTRIRNVDICIPCETDELYSILYNILIHKDCSPKCVKHYSRISELIDKLGMSQYDDMNEFIRNPKGAWTMLVQFLIKSGYTNIPKPKDIIVGYHIEKYVSI